MFKPSVNAAQAVQNVEPRGRSGGSGAIPQFDPFTGSAWGTKAVPGWRLQDTKTGTHHKAFNLSDPSQCVLAHLAVPRLNSRSGDLYHAVNGGIFADDLVTLLNQRGNLQPVDTAQTKNWLSTDYRATGMGLGVIEVETGKDKGRTYLYGLAPATTVDGDDGMDVVKFHAEYKADRDAKAARRVAAKATRAATPEAA